MGMPQPTMDWTAASVRELPDDGNRYEVVDGELLVTPAPAYRHQAAIGLLHYLLYGYLRVNPVAAVLFAPADVELDPRTLVQPDLFVVPLVGGRAPADWAEAGSLILAVEVLSPSSARSDRHTKRRRYQRAGAAEYWIVDLDARLIERWRPTDERPEILAASIAWQPGADLPALEIDVESFFGELLPPE